MIYSTLKEVYKVDTFEKKKKKKCVDDYSDNGDEVMSRDKDSKDRKSKDLYLQAMPTQCSTAPSRKHSMNNVKPFLDDELEHYFNFNQNNANTAAAPAPVPAANPVSVAAHVTAPATPVTATPVTAPATPVTAVTTVAVASTQSTKSKKDAYYKNLINIGLFVFIGILIIFLCDQITEIAINIGMKKTIAILEPYLARLEKLQKENNI